MARYIILFVAITILFVINILVTLISFYQKKKQYQNGSEGSLLYKRIITISTIGFKDYLKEIVKCFLAYIISLLLLIFLFICSRS